MVSVTLADAVIVGVELNQLVIVVIDGCSVTAERWRALSDRASWLAVVTLF
ncbi:hypothetical protein [Novipirellula aureliae]|uniref:hypothetical protein n=1 Tax=Novipirellula aureliae TaxID=2527966 RepID=UPI0018CE2DA3|nr:hypothetical protein [Novipirellula aureliae]